MALPTIPEYSDSIKTPALVYPEILQDGHPIEKGVRLIKYAGGFCVVFPYQTTSKKYAVRCWHAEVSNAKKRVQLIKWLKNFYDEYPNSKKGLYLHGSFGSGKTYLVAALLNELAKKNYKTVIMYYPEMLSRLKSTFDSTVESYNEVFDKIKTCDILLIDDIGAETVTNWSRDEILGTILQYRMEHELSTFLTSNLTIEELETHLSLVKNNMDKVKARRIIERIKQLTTDMELISVNRRN